MAAGPLPPLAVEPNQKLLVLGSLLGLLLFVLLLVVLRILVAHDLLLSQTNPFCSLSEPGDPIRAFRSRCQEFKQDCESLAESFTVKIPISDP